MRLEKHDRAGYFDRASLLQGDTLAHIGPFRGHPWRARAERHVGVRRRHAGAIVSDRGRPQGQGDQAGGDEVLKALHAG